MSPYSRFVTLVGLSAVFAGCSGGSSGPDSQLQVRCADGSNFCLVQCDLGCGLGTCTVTEVAENQRLQFVFSQKVLASSVNVSSFSLRTASGEAPDGQYVVDGQTITFVPAISVTAGVSTFGFRRNTAYIVTVAGGTRGVRSESGSLLSRSISCTVTATRGIIDEDNAPPRATLSAPTNLTSAPGDATIVVRFSEVVDTAPFLSPLSPSTPIHYVLRQTRVPSGGTDRVCNIDSEAIQIDGVPSIGTELVNGRPVSTISLRPAFVMPSLSCVEVQVTADVRDLAGRSAEESTFRFITAAGAVQDTSIVEDFATATRQDPDVSGGEWLSGARGAFVGGDGRHGSFNHLNGAVGANNTYTWSTDNQFLPGSQTFSGQDVIVTNGEFFFTDMVVPENTTVRFAGTRPAQIHVRGKVDIRGSIDCNGGSIAPFNCRNPTPTLGNIAVAGQDGSLGGPGGGRGGKGGDRCLGTGAQPAFSGANGTDLAVPAGHAYAGQAIGTGGRGSALYPAHGTNAQLVGPPTTYTISNLYNANLNIGGGGGGYISGGANGAVVPTAVLNTFPAAAQNNGGAVFGLLPLPTPNTSSLQHFLIGGSGGGGGGSHPFAGANIAVAQFQNDIWKAGGGGTGGGGALVIRAGRSLNIQAAAAIQARGGDGAILNGDNPITTTNPDQITQAGSFGVPAPGGGGSGGSVLLQADRDIVVEGAIDARGGLGSRTARAIDAPLPLIQPTVAQVDLRGGDGATGFYRLEARGTVSVTGTSNVPVFDANANRGPLVDRDSVSGARSTWRNTGSVFPPTWLRYELQVDTDNDGIVDRIFSDDPSVPNSVGPANDPLGPVVVRFQGARVNAANEPDPATIRLWRDFISDAGGIGVNSDAATGFRFELLFNNTQFPNAVVRRLTVFVRG